MATTTKRTHDVDAAPGGGHPQPTTDNDDARLLHRQARPRLKPLHHQHPTTFGRSVVRHPHPRPQRHSHPQPKRRSTLAQYEAYLEDFIRWVPRQSDAAAWKNQAPRDRYAKEVSDRLAHFFFLIDQNTGENRRAVQSSGRFQDWLTEFARQWGSFLDTTESFSQDILRSFLDDAPEYTIGASTGDRTCRADG